VSKVMLQYISSSEVQRVLSGRLCFIYSILLDTENFFMLDFAAIYGIIF